MEGVDIDIAVTLKAGVERDIGGIRVVVVRHIHGQRPHFKLIGPALSRVCPECQQLYGSEHAVHVHFGQRHRHLPWPWRVPSIDNVRLHKTRRAVA